MMATLSAPQTVLRTLERPLRRSRERLEQLEHRFSGRHLALRRAEARVEVERASEARQAVEEWSA